MWPFTREETSKETYNRLLKLTDDKDYGICIPPMEHDIAINELANHFLGDDWCCTIPQSSKQITTNIVYEIERLHPKQVKNNFFFINKIKRWFI